MQYTNPGVCKDCPVCGPGEFIPDCHGFTKVCSLVCLVFPHVYARFLLTCLADLRARAAAALAAAPPSTCSTTAPPQPTACAARALICRRAKWEAFVRAAATGGKVPVCHVVAPSRGSTGSTADRQISRCLGGSLWPVTSASSSFPGMDAVVYWQGLVIGVRPVGQVIGGKGAGRQEVS